MQPFASIASMLFQDPKVLCLLGDFLVESGQHDQAERTYWFIINNIDSRYTEARIALGNLYRRLRRDKEALDVSGHISQ